MSKALTQEEAASRIRNLFAQRVELISEYKNRRSNVTLQCLDCGYIWENTAQNVIYASTGCANHVCPNCGKPKAQKVKCAWCGKEINRSDSKISINKSGYFYCCREHGNLHKNQLRLESGEWDQSCNYRLKAFTKYEHRCACCGWDEDERILEVHHIDSNHNNNDIENLIILCPTCHRKITLQYYVLTEDRQIISV